MAPLGFSFSKWAWKACFHKNVNTFFHWSLFPTEATRDEAVIVRMSVWIEADSRLRSNESDQKELQFLQTGTVRIFRLSCFFCQIIVQIKRTNACSSPISGSESPIRRQTVCAKKHSYDMHWFLLRSYFGEICKRWERLCFAMTFWVFCVFYVIVQCGGLTKAWLIRSITTFRPVLYVEFWSRRMQDNIWDDKPH
jgi:hypothetical protein